MVYSIWFFYEILSLGFVFYFLANFYGTLFFFFLGWQGLFIQQLVGISVFWTILSYYFYDIVFLQKTIFIDFGTFFFLVFDTPIHFGFYFDFISYSFAFLTTMIGFFTHLYSNIYFNKEQNIERFLILLHFFIIGMNIVVLGSNSLTCFFGWESIGVASFFLINFWSLRLNTLKSSMKAFILNRFSDVCFFFFIIISYLFFSSTDLIVLNNIVYFIYIYQIDIGFHQFDLIEFLSILLFIAASIKSAQIGFHVWLPDSMEAPVPASALIHSATLVSAGIYLLLRFNSFFFCTYTFCFFVPMIGALTALYGSICALYQNDLKKILAYSTISHCGYLFFLTSTLNVEITILYLYVHGLFKALLFFICGVFIKSFKGVQDIRFFGNMYYEFPLEFYTLFYSFVTLSGLPFTFGLIPKHLTISAINDLFLYKFDIVFIIIFFISGVCGVAYSFRFFFEIFFNYKKSFKYSTRINDPLFFYMLCVNRNKHFSLSSQLTYYVYLFYLVISFILIYTYIYIFNNYDFSKNALYAAYGMSSHNYILLKKFNSSFFFLSITISYFIFFFVFSLKSSSEMWLSENLQFYTQILLLIIFTIYFFLFFKLSFFLINIFSMKIVKSFIFWIFL